MIAYEFYWRDAKKGYQMIGILPERRKNPKRITRETIMNWGKTVLGKNVNLNDIFFVKVRIDTKPCKSSKAP